MSDDLAHDNHLRAALRHAPDHALSPPAGVSQTILNAARHVHRPARPAATPMPPVRITTAPPRAWASLRQWFASPRLAGGLATCLVAALGLGLWFDLGEQPVIDREPARADGARDTAPTAGPATPASAVPTDATRAKRAARAPVGDTILRGVEQQVAKRETPATPRQAPERREDSGARETEALAKATPPPAVPPAAPEPTPVPDPALPHAESPAAPTVAEATPAAKAAAPAATDAAGASLPRSATLSEQRMSAAAGRAATVAGARAPSAEASSTVEAVAAASPALTLLRRARNEVASDSARWTWQPPGKPTMVPFDDAAQSWLLRVVQISRGRWADVNERAGGDALEVRWWRDDWPHATLRIESDGLRWVEPGGRTRFAPLDPAALQRLRNP